MRSRSVGAWSVGRGIWLVLSAGPGLALALPLAYSRRAGRGERAGLDSGIMAYMNEVNGGNGAQGPDPGSGGSGNWASPGSSGRPGGSGGWGGPGGFGGGKRLERKLEGRWLAGVCVGLADYLGVDANLVRVIVAVLVLFGGFGALAYVMAWALVPEEGEPASIAEKIINKNGTSGGQS
jgi:phage shock protein PspC (stress-responsive transcriptional regulator)